MEAMDEDSSRRWNTPGLYTVAPGVYRIPLPLPPDTLGAVNVYAVTDGAELVLIDSGWVLDGSRKLLADALRGLGAELGDVSRFLVTHVHRDHYTQAVALRREFGTPVALGEWEKESLAVSGDSSVPPMAAQVRLLRLAGAGRLADELARDAEAPRDDLDLWEPPDEWLVPGTRTVLPHRELRVVHTPGHTSGHVVFDDASAGLMFTGDHVLPHITPSLDYQPVPAKLPLRDYLHSLRLVRDMPDRMMLPAHGHVAASVHARIDELLAHHSDRLDQVGDAVHNGCTTAFEAGERLLWTRESCHTRDLPTFHAVLAVLETAMHLDLLVAQGKLAAVDVGGVRRYRAV